MKLYLSSETGKQYYFSCIRDLPSQSLLLFTAIICGYYSLYVDIALYLKIILGLSFVAILLMFFMSNLHAFKVLEQISVFHRKEDTEYGIGYWFEVLVMSVSILMLYLVVFFISLNFSIQFASSRL